MSLLMLGLSHNSAPLELREKMAFSNEETLSALKQLIEFKEINEVLILSTCNRTEIYADVLPGSNALGLLHKFLAEYADGKSCQLLGYTYHEEEDEAVNHLFTVVSSLDSMVLGEAQILGQARRAYEIAEEARTVSTQLNHLFRQAFEVGKRVRSETEIGKHSVSISTAAINIAKDEFESFEDINIVILGAGEMGQLSLNYLLEQGVKNITIVNRTLSRAAKLADESGMQAKDTSELSEVLAEADLCLASTSANDFALSFEQTKKALSMRTSSKKLVLMDLGLPRDIEPKVKELEGVHLYDFEDIHSLMHRGVELRQQEAQHARNIIEQEIDAFYSWRLALELKPTIAQMRHKAEVIRDKELSRASHKLKDLTPEEQEAVEAMANSIITKMLHGPFARLRKHAEEPDFYKYTAAARFLFGLDTVPDGLSRERRLEMLRLKKAREDEQKRESNNETF